MDDKPCQPREVEDSKPRLRKILNREIVKQFLGYTTEVIGKNCESCLYLKTTESEEPHICTSLAFQFSLYFEVVPEGHCQNWHNKK